MIVSHKNKVGVNIDIYLSNYIITSYTHTNIGFGGFPHSKKCLKCNIMKKNNYNESFLWEPPRS